VARRRRVTVGWRLQSSNRGPAAAQVEHAGLQKRGRELLERRRRGGGAESRPMPVACALFLPGPSEYAPASMHQRVMKHSRVKQCSRRAKTPSSVLTGNMHTLQGKPGEPACTCTHPTRVCKLQAV
jgi:hypothetical protein